MQQTEESVTCDSPTAKQIHQIMKLFRTSNIDIVNYCRAAFNFELPGTVIEQRTSQFRD